jgi:hypothetical protein
MDLNELHTRWTAAMSPSDEVAVGPLEFAASTSTAADLASSDPR